MILVVLSWTLAWAPPARSGIAGPELDGAFGEGGVVVRQGVVYLGTASHDGGLAAVGCTQRERVVLDGYSADGAIDLTFGTAGRSPLGLDCPTAVVMHTRGSDIVVASAGSGPLGLLEVGLASADGHPVRRFGEGGVITVHAAAPWGAPRAVTLLGRKVALLAHRLTERGRTDGSVAMFRGDGGPVRSFGDGGTLPLDGLRRASAMARVADGGLIVWGTTPRPGRIAALKLLADGAGDPSFGDDGRAVLRLPYEEVYVRDAAVDRSGRFYVLLEGVDDPERSTGDFAVARSTPEGSLDESFGGEGWVPLAFADPQTETVSDLLLDTRDGIVVLGHGYSSSALRQWRLLEDGSADPAWPDGGLVLDEPGPPTGFDVAEDDEGRLVVAGGTRDEGTPTCFFCPGFLLRLVP